ncbi:hypothetical protein G5I_12159 [Acromyrmex echinatior]|uniref:Uncharacterized protein n=1 Tax=Acromyrmex echinatior TaxID=103372 RepID=F4X1J8_ACREC|nr:hypothetical protein G5I_12159 [Acromyrmex echinatior]
MLSEEDDAAAGLDAEEPAVNPRPIKRTKQTYFFLRRSYRAAMSVSRITRCQMPIIFTRRWQLRCAALGRAPKKKGRAISAAKGRRSVLQFRRNGHLLYFNGRYCRVCVTIVSSTTSFSSCSWNSIVPKGQENAVSVVCSVLLPALIGALSKSRCLTTTMRKKIRRPYDDIAGWKD